MGIISNIAQLFKVNNPPKEPVDFDRDGIPLYKEDIIAKVMEELQKRKDERIPLELTWRLNANFLVGNQYCDYNINRKEIEQIPPVYDWMSRETFNQISPLIDTRIANLKKINYRMKVKPRTNEIEDAQKADVSTTLLQYLQTSTDFDTKKNMAIQWNELCGNCFWLTWWNPDKGDKVAEEDVSVQNDEDGTTKIEKKLYREGDIDYGLLSPYEVYPESIFKESVEAQRSIILEQVKTVDDVYDLYDLRVDGEEINTFALSPMPSGGDYGHENTCMTLGTRTSHDSVKVTTYMERPSRHQPDGKMIIIVGEDHLVYYGALPYSTIPIIQMQCREVAGQFFGKSIIEELIPRQRAYNGCINRIHEYIKRVAIGSYLVQEGAIDAIDFEENGCEPGSLLVYRQGYDRPEPIPIGVLPSDILQERQQLKNDMEYVAGTSQLMVSGNTPTGVESGAAIQNLIDIDNTRLSLTGDHIRNSIKNLAVMWLEIYKKYVTLPRIVEYVGKNQIGSALVWSSETINSYDVEYTTENELLLSEDDQKENFFNAMKMGLFLDSDGRMPQRVKQEALEFMKMGNYGNILGINELQIQSAQRENVMFEHGVIPKVSDLDDHEIHYDEHLRYALQEKFQILKLNKPEYAQALIDHIAEHKKVLEVKEQAKMMMMGGAAPNG